MQVNKENYIRLVNAVLAIEQVAGYVFPEHVIDLKMAMIELTEGIDGD